jgi:hypothetical protein
MNMAIELYRFYGHFAKEALNKSIPLMVRQAYHERNQQFTVRPEPVEGLNQCFPKEKEPHFS